ncbi:hydantoinase/oxoprolinase [Aspergillus luchuensis]|uniref:Hydantoinase/oxoprolinase n=1 Tax=Aspergillus kawachii TaxID=1069201 RepID=A0A146F0E2_ASPKA|nr:hydantoinase/oxoprolinase [Aspergillus luchuensis]
MAFYRIGVDVGGTNTDAAILNTAAATLHEQDLHRDRQRGVCASSKTPTTADVTSGICTAIVDVLAKAQIPAHEVRSVAIGTTHFVNAVVEADPGRLNKVAVVRLCGPYTRAVPPFSDFPPRLREIIGGPVFYLDGGLEIDGREIAPICPQQIEDAVSAIEKAGITTVALVGVFSPLDHGGANEAACKKLMLQQSPDLSVVCSADIGSVGLLERENATILNASILALAKRTIRAFCLAMKNLQLKCPLYLTQNDGTLTSAAMAAERPIQTFASGPTNSLTGAAYLAGLDQRSITSRTATQVLVMDVGGTTTDVCALLPSGFPRKAPNFVEVGGVRTAFPIPEVLSVGLGGGSRIHIDGAEGTVSVGPDSVGYHLTQDALVFGGNTMTSTDIVVASGKAELGERSRVKHLPITVLTEARAGIKKILERTIDAMKVSDQPVTLLLVGGGSIVYMDALEGVAECIVPPHHDSANAVGAAIAKVSGEVDVVEILEGRDEGAVVEAAKQQAIQAAIERGADKDDVSVVEVDKIPLQYVTNKAVRLVVKAVGKLATPAPGDSAEEHLVSWMSTDVDDSSFKEASEVETVVPALISTKHSASLDLDTYVPEVTDQVWYLSAVDLEFIATGTGVLGTGGGGPSYLQYLQCLDWLQSPDAKGRMRVVSPDSMNDSGVCVFGSWYGAPSVSGERIPAKIELTTAIDHVVRLSGHTHFEGIIADEIGGGNGMSTFPTSAYYDIPVLDGDLMGRAYPTMEHAESNRRVEELLRCQCVNLGISTAVAAVPLTFDIVKKYCIPNTVSQAWYLGRAIHRARRSKTDIIKAIFETTLGKLLYSGKIIDVKRDVSRGYTVGQCTIAPLSGEERENMDNQVSAETRHLVIPFQNEFLYAAYIDPAYPTAQQVICTVPDLISVLGQDGEAIGSQELRYGLRVNVIGMAAHPLWTGDERGLRVGGPRGFGLNMEWTSLGPYQAPRSVIAEFNQQL